MATKASSCHQYHQSKVLSKLDKIAKNYVKIAKKWSSIGYIYLFPKKYILIFDISYNQFNNTNLTFWQLFSLFKMQRSYHYQRAVSLLKSVQVLFFADLILNFLI